MQQQPPPACLQHAGLALRGIFEELAGLHECPKLSQLGFAGGSSKLLDFVPIGERQTGQVGEGFCGSQRRHVQIIVFRLYNCPSVNVVVASAHASLN